MVNDKVEEEPAIVEVPTLASEKTNGEEEDSLATELSQGVHITTVVTPRTNKWSRVLRKEDKKVRDDKTRAVNFSVG